MEEKKNIYEKLSLIQNEMKVGKTITTNLGNITIVLPKIFLQKLKRFVASIEQH